ncbi:MAG: UDP-N-acetylmuramoyl-tripeptide--D-alanyl-D-alanine ligase [Patescibacteria group bacterium]|nr:UDP-N-acetylmuramoyl-tripeptide--D-alanyl-D-alanine ligase [Patescibacteria group bacterium]MBU1870971.1 UDP-N-acetylmuramoyl-tripeptide--D-alanyl-D-alanine ligase [Patescibacteria group bacterium]
MLLFFGGLIFFFWLSSALVDYGNFCYFWQSKEYRLDCFKNFLSTSSGKNFLFSYPVYLRSIIYFVIFFLLVIGIKQLYPVLILMFIVDFVYNILKINYKQLNWPKATLKSIVIIVFSLIIEGSLFILLINSSFIFLLLACRWLIISSLIIIAKLPTKLLKIIYFRIAKNKLLQQNNLLIIGVTGSYGKTTVKNFLAQILAVKYRVIKTPTNINTDIGIAKFIINSKLSDFNVFIVEIGAYQRGDIKAICQWIKPKIGIITTISDQHLALFKTQENIRLGKYELLLSLPADGLAIINSDNEYCRQFLPSAVSPVKTFGKDKQFNPDCFIKDIGSNNQEINFITKIKNNNQDRELKILAPIIGQHNSLNIASAILVGLFLNISDEDIIKQCAKLKLPAKTLQIYNYGKSLIIDDSYNANPHGFLAALEVLDKYQGNWKKIVVARGMLELSKKSWDWHVKIGQVIAKVADELIIISPDFIEPLKKGVGNNKNISVKVELNSDKLLANFQQFKNEKNLILIEHRLPQNVYEEVTKLNRFIK